jgi:hypothetical protein
VLQNVHDGLVDPQLLFIRDETSGMPATVQWYTGIVRKKSKDKRVKKSFDKCSCIENLIKLFLI